MVTNTFLWDKEKKLFQKQNSQWNMQLNWSLNQNTFKKGGGNLRSLELCRKLALYRQNYCGCEFSRHTNAD